MTKDTVIDCRQLCLEKIKNEKKIEHLVLVIEYYKIKLNNKIKLMKQIILLLKITLRERQ